MHSPFPVQNICYHNVVLPPSLRTRTRAWHPRQGNPTWQQFTTHRFPLACPTQGTSRAEMGPGCHPTGESNYWPPFPHMAPHHSHHHGADKDPPAFLHSSPLGTAVGDFMHSILQALCLGELLPELALLDPAVSVMWGDMATGTMVQVHLKRSKCDQFGVGANIILGMTACLSASSQRCWRSYLSTPQHQGCFSNNRGCFSKNRATRQQRGTSAGTAVSSWDPSGPTAFRSGQPQLRQWCVCKTS